MSAASVLSRVTSTLSSRIVQHTSVVPLPLPRTPLAVHSVLTHLSKTHSLPRLRFTSSAAVSFHSRANTSSTLPTTATTSSASSASSVSSSTSLHNYIPNQTCSPVAYSETHTNAVISPQQSNELFRHIQFPTGEQQLQVTVAVSTNPSQQPINGSHVPPTVGTHQLDAHVQSDSLSLSASGSGAHITPSSANLQPENTNKNINPKFRSVINGLFASHKPSQHSFFRTLSTAPTEAISDPIYLNELYFRYQSAMHSTRAAVYSAPFLNSPKLRQRRIAIILDDDNLQHDSHHTQLEQMFRSFGASPAHEDTFGDLPVLASIADPQLAKFINTVDTIYRASTGAWCCAEVLSDDWLSAFARALSSHFPHALQARYFDEVFSGQVEIVHMLETVSLTEDILSRYPHMLEQTCSHAVIMAENLTQLWNNLENLTIEHVKQFQAKKIATAAANATTSTTVTPTLTQTQTPLHAQP